MTLAQRRSTLARDAVLTLGVALLYVACAKLGLALAVRAEQVSAVWPPTGFALAAVALLGRRAIPGVFLGAFAANATAGEPLWVAAGIGTGNTLEAVAAAAILSRARFDASLARLRDVMALLTAVTLAPCVSATIGIAFLVIGGVQPVSAVPGLWPVWWIGDALGGLIIGSLILVWSQPHREWRPRRVIEPALMLCGIAAAGSLVFSLPPNLPAAYVVYPFLIWSALRLGPAYTTTASLLVNAIAVIGTLTGHGPFAGAGPEGGLVLVQSFMAVGATTALFLGAVSAQSRLAHERADRSEQRLRVAMSGARIGVWDWDILSGEIVWSEGLEPLHGLAPGTFAGTYEAYRKTIHPDDVERVDSLIASSLETGAPYEAEFRLQGADGAVRWTSARGHVVRNDEGRAVRMLGVGIDVTRLKELEEELRLQHRRKDEFLAMLAHELRNPLAAIVHAVDLLSSRTPSEIDASRAVIDRQARTLARLVDDLLDVSRITGGHVALERRPIQLADVVNAAVDVWKHLVTQKRQRLTINAPTDSLWIDADATRLIQVFANLVHNAAKFTPERGTIAVTLTEENGWAVLRVRDDGRGMTPDVLAHAFELFVQGPPSLDRQQGGLGLGLTLVRRLVEMHAGTVEVNSAGTDRGTEVTVRLPLTIPEGKVAPDPITRSRSSIRRRVLVVEDNIDARDMLVYLLKRDGHDVRVASDGPSAIAESESFVPEIVFLDVGLPGLDGYEVARTLRAAAQTEHALLVALTGYGQEEDRQKAFDAGFDHHLLKPAAREEILRMMQMERAGRTA